MLGVESTVMADWDTDRIEQSHLREKLNDIASDVSRLVYALDGNAALDSEESLFDRVQKLRRRRAPQRRQEPMPSRRRVSAPPKAGRSKKAPVSDRLAALRDIQSRALAATR